MATCITCRQEFNRGPSEQWKRQCLDCYRDFRRFDGKNGRPTRIQKMGYKSGLYIAHPSVTAEDVNAFIRAKGFEHGWGATEWHPADWAKFRIFVNCEDYD